MGKSGAKRNDALNPFFNNWLGRRLILLFARLQNRLQHGV